MVELIGGVDAAHGPQQDFGLPLLDGAPWRLDVLRHDCIAHVGDRQPVGVQLLKIDDDVHFAGATAADRHLADAVDGFDRALDLLVGDLGQRPQAHRLGRHDDGHHRIGVGIDLLDDGRQHLRRHAFQAAGDFFTDVVRGVVDVALEHELDGDLRAAFVDPLRRHLVDAGDAAERLLHRFDDGAGHLVGAGAGKLQRDGDGRRIGLWKQVHAQVAEREDAEDHERHDQHRGEDRTPDAEF